MNRDDFRAGVNLSVRAVRELAERGVCLSCGVGRAGLEVKLTMVGSDLVTRRERREGVLSGCEEEDVAADCGGAVVVVGAVVAGGVSPLVAPNVKLKLELIDAPMVIDILFDLYCL